MAKKPVAEERVCSAYASTLLFIIKGSQDRNSNRAETWRQELMQRPWRGAAYWLSPCYFPSLLFLFFFFLLRFIYYYVTPPGARECNHTLVQDSCCFLKHAKPCDIPMIQIFPVLQAQVDICVFMKRISSF